MSDNYTSDDIQILTPAQHIKTRKGMYIGDATNPSPLFNEIFDNALDESSSGYSDLTEVYIDYNKNEYKIIDYGRGFPQGMIYDPNTQKEVETVELLCTSAFSGGKFNTVSYRLSTGLNGLGALVTSSLSSHFEIITWRKSSQIIYTAKQGETVSVKYEKVDKDNSGSIVTFVPDEEQFTDKKVPLNHIIMRCKIADAFNMRVRLYVKNEDEIDYNEIDVNSDIYDLLPKDDDNISEYYRYTFTVHDKDTGEYCAIALKYTSDTRTFYRGYTNLLYNANGGTHHKMLDKALQEAWSSFNVSGIKQNDVLLGLRAVVAVFISDTEFSSQSKERLSVPMEKLDKLKNLCVKEIKKWLKENDDIRNSLIKRFQEYRNSQNRLLDRKEIKSLLVVNNSKNGQIKRTSQVHKLRECESKVRDNTELFIVEGDSACGSAIQARDSLTQAIIPVRGKVFNVARCTNPKDALNNEETRAIINVIGAGIGDDADPSKSRYEKIIFMTDADADGKEIAVLLSGMFINLLPQLVKSGMVYVSLPPLYGWLDKKNEYHFTNAQSEIPSNIKESYRYKGLGEMNADELKISTMNPDTRRLIRLNYPDDINQFNSILTSSGVKYKMLEDSGVIKID